MPDVRVIDPVRYQDARVLFTESLGASEPRAGDAQPPYWDLDRTFVVHDERGELAGVAARFDSEMTLPGGDAVSCGAVPNVGVRADHQGRGVGRALLERQVRDAAAGGDHVLALNASQTDIYGRFGYAPTSRWWSVRADLHRVAWRDDAPADPGTIRELPDDLDAAREAARGVVARAWGGWHGEVARSDGWWARWGRREPQDPSRAFVAVHEVAGELDAYVQYGVKFGFDDTGFANELKVWDLVGTDELAEAHLLRWLCGRRLAGRLTMERCNPRTPIPLMLRDGRQWHTTSWADAVWVRVLDLPAVAGGRATTARDGTAVVVRVVDELVPAMDGTWRLAAEDGQVSCEPVDATPQLTVPTSVLASLLWAFVPVTTAVAAGRVRLHHDQVALDAADALLAWPRPAWCSTGF